MKVTTKDLEKLVESLNDLFDTSKDQWNDFRIIYATGGCKLIQTSGKSGGSVLISSGGSITKKELYHQIFAIMSMQYALKNR